MKRNNSHKTLSSLLSAVSITIASAATASESTSIGGLPSRTLPIEAFVKLVQEKNTGVENQRLAVDTAVANKSPMSAPNLNPQFTYSRGSYYGQTPYTPYVSPSSNTYALQATLEGWGKRSARSKVADSEILRSQSELDSATNNIELDASFAYLDALRPKLNIAAYQNSVSQLKRIGVPGADSLMQDYALKAQQEDRSYQYYVLGMLNLIPQSEGFIVQPTGRGECKVNNKTIDELLKNAMDGRADITSMNNSVKVAEGYVDLAKANRNIDLTPSIWTSKTPSYTDAGYSYGATSAYGFSVQIPIPTSLITDTSVQQAMNTKAQAENNREQLKKQVQVELRQSAIQYETALNAYRSALSNLQNAEKAYPPNSKRNIQTVTDYQLAIIDARINHSKALVFLMNKSGHYGISAYCENQ